MRKLTVKRDWQSNLFSALQTVGHKTRYAAFCQELEKGKPSCGLHLAVLVEPYLTLVLEGKKTIESRFSVNRHAPFEQVQRGDVIILKQSSGPVVGMCKVADAWFYHLDPDSWSEIERYASALCMDDSSFWKEKRGASYASLMRIEDTVRIPHIEIEKLDPRGWVVLHSTISGDQKCLF